jgi:type II secretory pathway pseudopilin PulG
MHCPPVPPSLQPGTRAFSFTDLLVVMAVLSVLAAVAVPLFVKNRAGTHLAQCLANLRQINHAVQMYADDHQHRLPHMPNCPAPGAWWFYKEQVKGYLGLSGPSSRGDKVFACPDDRGYGESAETPQPFHLSNKHDYTSYVFNSVDLPRIPSLAGRELPAIRDPAKTLLVMEWTAHAPLSWHRSRTGRANTPFYNNAESVVGFADGHAALILIYFDGCNPAYTREPIPGYAYKYGGD